jgi:hypothetical protein
MVRNYKRKNPGPLYAREDLAKAMQLILVEKWTYRKASAQFKIPLGTLSSHALYTINDRTGHPPALTRDEEEYLVKLVVTLQEWGQLSTCQDVLTYAKEYVDIMGLKLRFASGEPSKDWYHAFVKRWSTDLKLMRSSSLESSRAEGVTREVIDGWFTLLHDVLKKLDVMDKIFLTQMSLDSLKRPVIALSS